MTLRIIHFFIITFLARFIESIEDSKAVPATTPNDLELVFLTVVFRHGDRTPLRNEGESYPNDPYSDYDYYPINDGGLTNAGKYRAYELGFALRHRYDDFLGQTYIPYMIDGKSTNTERTKMSLMLVTSSLYQPKGKQKWNDQLNWQPIPVTYLDTKKDILMISNQCPLYYKEWREVRNSRTVQTRLEKFEPIMGNLSRWTGKNIRTPGHMYSLYHTLMAQYSMKLKLPEWTRNVFPYGLLYEGAVFQYELTSFNTKLRRLYGGVILRNIIDNMIGIADGIINNGKKINLFSCHENNIAALLLTLGVYKPHVPQYSSGVIFELLKNPDDKYYVRIVHYLGIPSVMKVLVIPGCDEYCSLEDFIELLTDVTPSDEEMRCPR